MSKPFENRTIIITGAGKGLGRAYALYLAGLGARLVVNNRSHEGDSVHSADRVVEEIHQQGGTAVADYSSVENRDCGAQLLETALSHFGRLDCVIANAGISEGRTFRKQNLADFQSVIDINLMGTVNILHPCFCHLYDQGSGDLLVSTSVAGLYGEHGLPAYSASKAALLGLMYSLSREGAGHGVRVNALAPYAATQMTEDNLPPGMRKMMDPAHVAPVVAWLTSPNCEVNGEIIISGANRFSRAQIRESAPVPIESGQAWQPEALTELWKRAVNSPHDFNYDGALAHFRAFVAD